MSDFLQELEAQIKALENALSSDSRYRKLTKLREALAEYQADAIRAINVRPVALKVNGERPPVSLIGSMGSAEPIAPPGYKLVPLPKVDRIRAETTAYLRSQTLMRAHRSKVADHLLRIGVMGEVKDPVASLSVYLARWPEFASDGTGNVILRETVLQDAAHE